MPKKRYNAEEIIHKLRGTDVLLGQGKTVSQAYKEMADSRRVLSRCRTTRFESRCQLESDLRSGSQFPRRESRNPNQRSLRFLFAGVCFWVAGATLSPRSGHLFLGGVAAR
jgi:hypothetical protein